MTDEELREKFSSEYKTTSFGPWSRTPEAKGSKRIDAIRNLRGVSIDATRNVYIISTIRPSKDEVDDIDIEVPKF